MKIHNSNIQVTNKKYSCNICGHKESNKRSLVIHKKIIHDGVRQCNYQASAVESLAQHKRAVMKQSNILAINATIRHLQIVILLPTKEQYMKESNILVDIAIPGNYKGKSYRTQKNST